MNELKANTKIKISTEKNFGYTFFFIFFILSIYLFIISSNFYIYSLTVSIIFIFFTIFFSKALKYPNIFWHRTGLFIGLFISPIIILITYLLTILPIGLFFKITRQDLINKNMNKNVNSYWSNRKERTNDMKNQY